jgi:hypothetical protein
MKGCDRAGTVLARHDVMRAWVGLAAAGAAFCSLFPACSGGVGARSTAGIGDACDRWITALADRLILPDDLFAPDSERRDVDLRSFGPADRAAVLASYRGACVDVATIDGSAIDAAFLDRCLHALTTRTSSAIPLDCVPPAGSRGDGEGCLVDHQCASLHCAGGSARLRACGACAPALRDGATCTGDCGFGYLCAGTIAPGTHGPGASLCVARALGAQTSDPCSGVTCGEGTYCDYATASCVPARALGAACDEAWQCASGLTCKEHACIAAHARGDVCDVDVDCGIDDFCAPSKPPPGPGGPGVCTQAPTTGGSCDDWYVQCGRRRNAYCRSSCGGPMTCIVDSGDYQTTEPGGTATGNGCAIWVGSNEPCGPCPRLVADGDACGPEAACAPRSACLGGACRPISLGCP